MKNTTLAVLASLAVIPVLLRRKKKTKVYKVFKNKGTGALDIRHAVWKDHRLVWKAEGSGVPDFVIHFEDESFAENKKLGLTNDFPGRKGSPAECTVCKEEDGHYAYTIVSRERKKKAPLVPPPEQFVKNCRFC